MESHRQVEEPVDKQSLVVKYIQDIEECGKAKETLDAPSGTQEFKKFFSAAPTFAADKSRPTSHSMSSRVLFTKYWRNEFHHKLGTIRRNHS